jgi:hypothetical protein
MSVNEGPTAHDVEDVGVAIRVAPLLDSAANRSIARGHDSLNFSSLDVPDPVIGSATAVEES